MIPYSDEMFNDDVVLYRSTLIQNSKGASQRVFLDDGIPLRASVQTRTVDRTDASGRVYSVVMHWIYTPDDPAATPNDKFEWLSRTLTPESGSVPKGINNVLWLTECLETS